MLSGDHSHTHRSVKATTHSGRHIEPADSSGRNPRQDSPERSPPRGPRSSTSAKSASVGAVPSLADRVQQQNFSPDITSGGERAQRQALHPYGISFPDQLQQLSLRPQGRSLPDTIPQQSLNPYATPSQSLPNRLPTQKNRATLGFGSPIEAPSSVRELQRSFSGGTPSSNQFELPRSSPGPVTRMLPEFSETGQVHSLGPPPTRHRDQPRLASIHLHTDPGKEPRAHFGSARAPPGFPEKVSFGSFGSHQSSTAASPATVIQPQPPIGPVPSFTTVTASVTDRAVSKGVSQQSRDPLPLAKAGSGLAGTTADFPEKVLQQSTGPLPPARKSSRPLRAPPGFPERDPCRFIQPSTSAMEGSATASSRPSVPDPTQQSSSGSLANATRSQPCLVPITIHPDPSNIAAIRRLINQYTHRIKAAGEGRLLNQMEMQKLRAAIDDTEVLCRTRLRGTELLPALLENPSQVQQRKLVARQALLQRQGEDAQFEQRILSLQGRRVRLQEALSLVACPPEFQNKMKWVLEYLLSIPDHYNPNIPGVNWDNSDNFEKRPLD